MCVYIALLYVCLLLSTCIYYVYLLLLNCITRCFKILHKIITVCQKLWYVRLCTIMNRCRCYMYSIDMSNYIMWILVCHSEDLSDFI